MIFDLNITDEYISGLNRHDLMQLKRECHAFQREKENEIRKLVWGGDGENHNPDSPPELTLSRMDYSDEAWRDEIEAQPWMKDRLAQVRHIVRDIGVSVGIEKTCIYFLAKVAEDMYSYDVQDMLPTSIPEPQFDSEDQQW